MAIRVLVADDHQMVRAGIAQFLIDEPDMVVAAEAHTGAEAIKLVRNQEFDVVLLDISMPDKNGIDCLRILRQLQPRLPILILSSFPEEKYAVNVLRSGANGYISKSAPPEQLLKAIRTVARGNRYLSDIAADLVSAELTHPQHELHHALTEREFQIFHKLASGLSVTQIGKELNLSVKTISSYRHHILDKLRLKNNADITKYAMNAGLIG